NIRMKKTSLIAALGLLSLASCKNDISPEKNHANGLNLNKYVAIGNSLTAGYANNALYKSGQESSYPAIIAAQLKNLGVNNFRQPLLVDDNGYPQMKLKLGYKENCATGVISLATVPLDGMVNPDNATNISTYGPFNNIA